MKKLITVCKAVLFFCLISSTAFALPAFEITPSAYHFGEVEIGSSNTMIMSITALSLSNDVIVYDVGFREGSSSDFSVPDFTDLSLPRILSVDHLRAFEAMSGILYFAANDSSGIELWKSDGTEAGTVMVKDINPQIHDFNHIRNIEKVDGTLIFAAYTPEYGTELWKSDGTEAGTVLLKDINPGPDSSSITYFTPSGSTLYFSLSGDELWKSDGTEAGTVLVKDISPSMDSSWIKSERTNVRGNLFFVVETHCPDGTYQKHLWKSDGTEVGTTRVSDTAFLGIRELTDIGGDLFFIACQTLAYGSELWKSDGTATGTYMIKDINPGTSSSEAIILAYVGGLALFVASDGVHGMELWRSDGTEAGTQLISDILPGPGDGVCRLGGSIVLDGVMFFVGWDSTGGCGALWRSDGTAAGTYKVKEITGTFSLWNGTLVDSTLYFRASTADYGWELWKSDGTEAGTMMVKDINSGPETSNTAFLTDVDGLLYFSAYDSVAGQELWKSDGTEAGTLMVKDISPGVGMTMSVPVTYSPTSAGPAAAELMVACTGPPFIVYVPFEGIGVIEDRPPLEQIADILDFIDDGVDAGTITGDGPGASASGRLRALTNMIEAAGDILESGCDDEACRQLQDAFNRCDGETRPPDFVTGDDAAELAVMIETLMTDLGCI